MAERRLSNSELRLERLEREEPCSDEERGILELFDDPQAAQDAPLARDDERQ
ncbi:MAG: hypothetical protein ACRDLK_05630 [Gaiellaceae bacterium]